MWMLSRYYLFVLTFCRRGFWFILNHIDISPILSNALVIENCCLRFIRHRSSKRYSRSLLVLSKHCRYYLVILLHLLFLLLLQPLEVHSLLLSISICFAPRQFETNVISMFLDVIEPMLFRIFPYSPCFPCFPMNQFWQQSIIVLPWSMSTTLLCYACYSLDYIRFLYPSTNFLIPYFVS